MPAPGKPDGTGMESPGAFYRAERKLIRSFEKEISFFREEKWETGKVYPSLIGLGLGKVGIDGQSGGQARRPLVKQIEPAFEIKIIRAIG